MIYSGLIYSGHTRIFETLEKAIFNFMNVKLRPGDHIILPDDVYYGVRHLTESVFERWGLLWSVVDLTDLEALEKALRPHTRLVWAETPSNPMLKVTDLQVLPDIGSDHRPLMATFSLSR